MRVGEIRVKRISVNQGLGVYKKTSLFMEWQTELLVIIYKDWF